MEYKKLGRTGLDVSRICLGCMSYGRGNQGNHAWSLGEEESRPFIKPTMAQRGWIRKVSEFFNLLSRPGAVVAHTSG
jgi:hypothetical protein